MVPKPRLKRPSLKRLGIALLLLNELRGVIVVLGVLEAYRRAPWM